MTNGPARQSVRQTRTLRRVLPLAWRAATALVVGLASARAEDRGLWSVYETALKGARYVDLTHTITPRIPVWAACGGSVFRPAQAENDVPGLVTKGETFSYAKHGFEATQYWLHTDQLGTQIDPPAHWAPEYPAIDEIPPTYAVRPFAGRSLCG